MATGEQIKSLIKTHFDRDDEKFKTVVLQIAAYEAKLGHTVLARELKVLLDKQGSKGKVIQINNQNQMLSMMVPDVKLSELVVSSENHERIYRILNEYTNRAKLRKHGLLNRRKILLEGAPGTGKTMTASIIASELHLPLFVVQMDKLVTKFMGETSVKLRQILLMIFPMLRFVYWIRELMQGIRYLKRHWERIPYNRWKILGVAMIIVATEQKWQEFPSIIIYRTSYSQQMLKAFSTDLSL